VSRKFELFGSRPSESIWRYTNLAKLLNIIDDNGNINLVALRAGEFDDGYEGTFSKKAVAKLESIVKGEPITRTVDSRGSVARNYPDATHEYDKRIFGTEKVEKYQSGEDELERINRRMREITYANCWNIGEGENSTMWFAYTKPSDGVVIKSSFDNIEGSIISANGKLILGCVEYIDFEDSNMQLSPVAPFFYKKEEFNSESEFRFVLTDYEQEEIQPDGGIDDMPKPTDRKRSITLDASEFIDEIRVHPTSGSHLRNVVEDIFEDSNIKVSDSSLKPNLS